MFFRKLNWNIVGWFRVVSLISYLVIGLGLAAMIYHGFTPTGFQPSHMLKLGLSFTGGTAIDVKFAKPVGQNDVNAGLASLGLSDEKVTTLGTNGDRFSIETQTAFANNSTVLWDALNKVAPVDRASSSITAVGPTLGQEYLTKALWALVIALSIQFLYIAFRFGWNYIFGLVTVIALVRDAAMMIGIYALADKRADDAFLAAVLTVIGYSVMDTIVILDRIRENTKLMAGQPYDRIVNTSILQTMTRSFNTLATVVITLVALLALGGASLKNFAFALLVGICSGGCAAPTRRSGVRFAIGRPLCGGDGVARSWRSGARRYRGSAARAPRQSQGGARCREKWSGALSAQDGRFRDGRRRAV
jgi:preprotein translocase subunit SecF